MRRNNSIVAAGLTVLLLALPVAAQDGLDDLFVALQAAEGEDAARIVQKIGTEWSRSGSAAMDMLLQRGRDALEAGDTDRALMHLSALIDHAPDFAEGYSVRATAFYQTDQYGPALDDIRQTLALNPRHFGAMTGLGIMLEGMDRPKQALDAWRAVQAIWPSSPQAGAAIVRLSAAVEGRTL